jgi:hypothetical protein
MASALHHPIKKAMIEKQTINGRDFWIRVDQHPANRENPNVIPTEYFSATYFRENPESNADGETLLDEDGEKRFFESPVAALTAIRRKLERES